MSSDFPPLTRLTAADVLPAGRMLARAFRDDPLVVHFVPDPVQRERRCSRGLACILRYGLLCGEAYAVSAKLEGIAVWLPPEAGHPSWLQMLRSGFFWLPFSAGWAFFRQFCACHRHVGEVRRREAPFRHWYLQLLGVDPQCQRQGHAGRLLQPVLARLDREDVPCVLDTMNGNNLAVYERFGFKVAAETRLPQSDVRCWMMVRRRSPAD